MSKARLLCWAAFAASGAASIAAAMAAAPADNTAATLQRGEQIYSRCVACHAINRNRTGPLHCGLFGRRAGTATGYDNYSVAMRRAGIVWTERSLDTFLAAPLQTLPGTSMGYAGIRAPAERADLIAWLRQATQPGVSCQQSR